MLTVCANCGVTFKARPWRIAQGWARFCSLICRDVGKRVGVTCRGCGAPFTGYLIAKRVFCSQDCMMRHRVPWNKGKPWSLEMRTKLKASVGDRRGANNPHWNGSVLARKCKTCKRVFRPKNIKRAKAGYGIYCSKVCYQKAKGETVPERLVREALGTLGELYHPQAVIGFWTVDFLLPFKTTIIEVDGDWWHGLPGAARRDKAKTSYFTNRGFRVIRMRETEIRHDAVAALRAVL